MFSLKSLYQHSLGTGCRGRRELSVSTKSATVEERYINSSSVLVPQKNFEGYVAWMPGTSVRIGFYSYFRVVK